MKRVTLITMAVLLAAASTAHAGWWRTFGGEERDEGTCVQQTTDGGYVITGVTYSFGPDERNMWLIKLDSLGHKEWDRTYEEGIGYSVRETSDSGYVIAGSTFIKTDVNGDILWTKEYTASCVQITHDGGYILLSGQGGSVCLLKVNEKGDTIWAQLYPQMGNNGDAGKYVEQTSDSGYVITGIWTYEDPEQQAGMTGLLLIRTDAQGGMLWSKSYGGEEWGDTDWGECVRQTEDGGFIIAGLVEDYFLIKTDENGDSLWAKEYRDGLNYGTGFCVEQTFDGGYIIAGSVTKRSVLSSPSTWDNLWLVKTDANGDTTWTRDYGDGNGDRGYYVQQTSDDGYIVVGETYSFGAGSSDLYLLKTDSLGLLAIVEGPQPKMERNWQVVSAIGSQVLLAYWNSPQGFKAEVFDASGRKTDVLESASSSGTISWGNGNPSGVYFIRRIAANNSDNTERIIIFR